MSCVQSSELSGLLSLGKVFCASLHTGVLLIVISNQGAVGGVEHNIEGK